MDNMDKLRALAWEARRRGMMYGQLVGRLKSGEEEGISVRWRCGRTGKARRERKKKHPHT